LKCEYMAEYNPQTDCRFCNASPTFSGVRMHENRHHRVDFVANSPRCASTELPGLRHTECRDCSLMTVNQVQVLNAPMHQLSSYHISNARSARTGGSSRRGSGRGRSHHLRRCPLYAHHHFSHRRPTAANTPTISAASPWWLVFVLSLC
jgi:hypothetical protein